jgi:hypothetical protein
VKGTFEGLDIIAKLRISAQDGREIIEPWQMDPNLYDEAADEIERLRKMAIDMQEIKLIASDWRYSSEAVGIAFRNRLRLSTDTESVT